MYDVQLKKFIECLLDIIFFSSLSPKSVKKVSFTEVLCKINNKHSKTFLSDFIEIISWLYIFFHRTSMSNFNNLRKICRIKRK